MRVTTSLEYIGTANNYAEFGTPNKRATYICPMHKARVAANAYYWNKLYRNLGLDNRFKLYLPKEECLKFMTEEQYNEIKELEVL